MGETLFETLFWGPTWEGALFETLFGGPDGKGHCLNHWPPYKRRCGAARPGEGRRGQTLKTQKRREKRKVSDEGKGRAMRINDVYRRETEGATNPTRELQTSRGVGHVKNEGFRRGKRANDAE